MDIEDSICFWRSEIKDPDLASLATQWLFAQEDEGSIDMHVTGMTFIAPEVVQWRFIQSALDRSETDEQLSKLAAGPVEGFMGRFGDSWIEALEKWARENPKVRRMLDGVWQHQMSDATWTRVQALKTRQVEGNPQ